MAQVARNLTDAAAGPLTGLGHMIVDRDPLYRHRELGHYGTLQVGGERGGPAETTADRAPPDRARTAHDSAAVQEGRAGFRPVHVHAIYGDPVCCAQSCGQCCEGAGSIVLVTLHDRTGPRWLAVRPVDARLIHRDRGRLRLRTSRNSRPKRCGRIAAAAFGAFHDETAADCPVSAGVVDRDSFRKVLGGFGATTPRSPSTAPLRPTRPAA